MTEIQYKFDVINHLIGLYGYRSYLEVATPQSGFHFAAVTDSVHKERIWSRASDSDDDGQPVAYRMSSDEAFTTIHENGQYYDIILVDAWHTFAQAEKDILNSLECLFEYGSLVVHDCNPPEEDYTGEAFMRPDGSWCGDVYQVIIKLRMTRQDLSVCVVDTDLGCAVIQKRPSLPLTPPAGLGFEDCIRWEYFSQNRKYLLNLISTSEFLEHYRLLADRDSGLARLEAELLTMQQTIGWRVMERLRRAAPLDSRRRAILLALLQVVLKPLR